MIPFVMVIGHIFPQNIPQRRLTHHDHLVQRFPFARAYEPFAMGIQMRRPSR